MRFLIFLLFLLPLSLIGQVESQFNGTLNVFSGSRIGSTNTFTISGIFNSTTTSYTSANSATGDIVQVQSGARFYWLHIYSIASNSGGVITCNVRDSSSTLTTFPLGKWNIFRPTPNLRLPLSPDGESNASKSATFNTLALRVDDIQTAVSSATNCEQTITKTAHGFRKWTPIFWNGSTYIRPTADSLVPDYIVVDSLTANTFKVASCGTYTTTLSNGLYWFTSASPGYSLTADTTKVPLFQVLNTKLILNPIVGFNLMSGGGSGDVTRDELADSTAAIRADFPSGGITDGDKGDITVTSSGATWTIDNGVISNAKLGTNAVDSTKAANLSPNDLAQTGATIGQALVWTGSKYAPRDISGGGGSGNGWKMVFQNAPPSDTTVVWVDTLKANIINGAYPIRFRTPGAWQAAHKSSGGGLWYDPVGKQISNGYPLVVGVTGQSNFFGSYIEAWTPSPNSPPYNGYWGDTIPNPMVTAWDTVTNSLRILDLGRQRVGNCCSSGANAPDQFAKAYAKKYGRSVRLIYFGIGGRPIEMWSGGVGVAAQNAPYYIKFKQYVDASAITRMDVLLFSQGEQANSGAEGWYKQFKEFTDTLKNRETWFDEKTIIIASGLGFTNSTLIGNVGNSNESDAKKLMYDDNIYDTWQEVYGVETDGIHFTPKGHEELGRRLFSTYEKMPMSRVKPGINTSPGTTALFGIADTLTYQGGNLQILDGTKPSVKHFGNEKFYGDGQTNSVGTPGTPGVAGLQLRRFDGSSGVVKLSDYQGNSFTMAGNGSLQWTGGLFYSSIIRVQSASGPEFQLYDVVTDMFKLRNSNTNVGLDILWGVSSNTRIASFSRDGRLYINPLTASYRTVRLDVNETATSGLRGQLFGQYSSDARGVRTYTRKARNTQQTPSTIVTGDTLAANISQGYDGTNYLDGARVSVISGTVGSGSLPSSLLIETNSGSGLIEAVRFNSSQETIIQKCIILSTIWLDSGKTVGIFRGTGTPESVVTASVGSTFHRTDGGAGTSFYVKESGTGNTGWVAK